MSNVHAGSTPNIEARHMPHTNYSAVYFDDKSRTLYGIDRNGIYHALYRVDPPANAPAESDSTAHGLTQYPVPMSDGKLNTKSEGGR